MVKAAIEASDSVKVHLWWVYCGTGDDSRRIAIKADDVSEFGARNSLIFTRGMETVAIINDVRYAVLGPDVDQKDDVVISKTI